MEMVLSLEFMCFLIFDMFIVNYCGQVLINQSELITTYLYNLNWTETGRKFQHDLTLFIMFAAKPMKLRAGKYLVTSYELFMELMRLSFSYFTLMSDTASVK